MIRNHYPSGLRIWCHHVTGKALLSAQLSCWHSVKVVCVHLNKMRILLIFQKTEAVIELFAEDWIWDRMKNFKYLVFILRLMTPRIRTMFVKNWILITLIFYWKKISIIKWSKENIFSFVSPFIIKILPFSPEYWKNTKIQIHHNIHMDPK